MGRMWNNSRSLAIKAASKLPFVRGGVQLGARLWGRSPQFRDIYSRDAPSPASPFTIFLNAWSSAVPGFDTGKADLFNDPRIKWLEVQLGSFSGRRVLELGPLEGGHTYMMEQAGASVVAIEANQRAFLKCLIVKDAFHLESEFLYGDFRPYLANPAVGRFDFVVAIGVLYHMLEPIKLLHDIARVTNAFGLWTHYYDPAVVRGKLNFDPNPILHTVEGKSAEVYRQHYLSSLALPTFCGGSEPTSCWLTKDGLLQYIQSLGFETHVGEDNPRHPNGPCILLFATRS
jgi:SAM-dependent methyltransferase